MDWLSVETLARDGNCLCRVFHSFVVFEPIHNNSHLRTDTKRTWEE
jgi:hypothetical protein